MWTQHFGRTASTAVSGAAACVSAYYITRVCEERAPFEKIDDAFGAGRAREEHACWRATNPPGATRPEPLAAVRASNKACIRRGVSDALAEVVAGRSAFAVTKQVSSVPASGDGARLRGCVARGGIVTFYHGPVYTPIIGRIKIMFAAKYSEYVLNLFDSYVIDGCPTGASTDGAAETSFPDVIRPGEDSQTCSNSRNRESSQLPLVVDNFI